MSEAKRCGPIGAGFTIELGGLHAWRRLYERWNPPGVRHPSFQGSPRELLQLVRAQIERRSIPYDQIMQGLRFPADDLPDEPTPDDTGVFFRTAVVVVAEGRFQCKICCKVLRPAIAGEPGLILVKTFYPPIDLSLPSSPRRRRPRKHDR